MAASWGVLARLGGVLEASWTAKPPQHKPDSTRNGKRRFFSNGFFGSLWLSVALCGPLFFPMALCESLWLSVALGGSLWPSVYRSCSIWLPKSTLKPSKIIPNTIQNPALNAPKSRSGGGCASDRFWNPFFPASWGVLGRLVRLLGPPWGVLGASWARLGASWARLGGVLGRLGRVLGASWGVLGASWGVLVASWGVFGSQKDTSRLGHDFPTDVC